MPVADASTGDTFPARPGFDPNQPRDRDGRWTEGGGGSLNVRLTLVSDPEKVKRRFEEGLAGGPGPHDDPIAPPGEDPIIDPLTHAASHGPMESVPPALVPLVSQPTPGLPKQAIPTPTSILRPIPADVGLGPFARESIPAGPSPRPSAAQQLEINRLFDLYGCHMCGTKDAGTNSGNAVGDHQPPTGLNLNDDEQCYLPQCKPCMCRQGGRVRWLRVKGANQ